MNRVGRVTMAAGVVQSRQVEQQAKEYVRMGHKPFARVAEQPPRNSPCPCKSGKKWKNCCMAKVGPSIEKLNYMTEEARAKLLAQANTPIEPSTIAIAK